MKDRPPKSPRAWNSTLPRPSKPLRNKTPMPRGASQLKRSGPIKAKPRSAKEFARIYGSKARVKFVERLPCAACGYAGEVRRENAHTKNDGLSRKGHYTTIIPLCRAFTVEDFRDEDGRSALNCHGRQHAPNGGWLAIGMTAESCRRAAALTEEAWQAHLNRGNDDAESGAAFDAGSDD